jgi:hypothetical protein
VAGRSVIDRHRQAAGQPQQVRCVHGYLPSGTPRRSAVASLTRTVPPGQTAQAPAAARDRVDP